MLDLPPIKSFWDYCPRQWGWMREQNGWALWLRLLAMPYYAGKYLVRKLLP